MRSDLRTLLRETAPRPRQPVDVDEVFTRVRRRRAGRVTGGVAAVLVVVALAVGLSQLVGGQPSLPIVDEVDEQPVDEIEDGADESTPGSCGVSGEASSVSSLERSGAFDRGCGETLTLDLATDDRLRGRELAETEIDVDWRGGSFAVASDRAVGGSYSPRSYEQSGDPRMAIFVDGQQVATRTVDQQGPVAFDSDGTLWSWTGSGVAGLRRDGTTIDHEVTIPAVPTSELPDRMGDPVVSTRLRITGTNVSVVFTVDTDRSWAHVVPVVGQDPLAGEQTVDSPLPDFGPDWRIDTADFLAFSDDSVLTGELLLSGSILGTARAELDWRSPPDSLDFGGSEQSQIVADTSASILYEPRYDPDAWFLIVHRRDGVTAVALVEGTPVDQISVSPDGAVHLIPRPGPTTAPTVRTLLDPDLQPVIDPAVLDNADATGAFEQVLACREPSADDRAVVEDADLDGDGANDRVTLHQDGLILACLADGRVTAAATWPPSFYEADGLDTLTLQRVDLAGTDGVALILEPDDFAKWAYLLRLVDGELGIIGGPNADRRGGRSIAEAGEWIFGPDHSANDPDSPDVYFAFGCRPSTSGDAGFEIAEIEVAAAHQVFKVHGVVGWSLVVPRERAGENLPEFREPIVDVALDQLTEADLNQLMRDHGFTPRCIPDE